MIPYAQFLDNLARVRSQIAEACRSSGRLPEEVALLPVTKNHPEAAPLYAHRAGIDRIGENRVQEAAAKKEKTGVLAPPLHWELIGHLQSNKAKAALSTFERIQSVDSVQLAERLNRIRAETSSEPFPILLEVNSGEDPNKFGLTVQNTEAALETILNTCQVLRVDGLMTVAPLEGGRCAAARAFAALRELRERLRVHTGLPLHELSMGMSGDLEEAIAEGSTMVRVGTALFGERDYTAKLY